MKEYKFKDAKDEVSLKRAPESMIRFSGLHQLIKAETKDYARKALVDFFNKDNGGSTLIEARVNDTITNNGETIP